MTAGETTQTPPAASKISPKSGGNPSEKNVSLATGSQNAISGSAQWLGLRARKSVRRRQWCQRSRSGAGWGSQNWPAAAIGKKDPPAAKQPQGAPRKDKDWDCEKTLVEEGSIRQYVREWVDAPGGRVSDQCGDDDDDDDDPDPPPLLHRIIDTHIFLCPKTLM